MPENKIVQKTVPFTQIKFGERFRQDYTGVEELALSIHDKGLLQPIIVDQHLNLLAGGRRFKAIEYLRNEGSDDWEEVNVTVRQSETEMDAREIELIENMMRRDLSWDEKIMLTREIHRLYEKNNKDWSGRKTAELLERSVGSVASQLQLADALDAVPELKKAKNADQAKKILDSAYLKAALSELAKRTSETTSKESQDLDLLISRGEIAYIVKDVFEGMAEMVTEDLEVSFIEVDPPYAVDLAKMKRPSKTADDSKVHEYIEIEKEDYVEFLNKLCKELYRVSSPYMSIVFWFGSQWYKEVYTALTDAKFKIDPIPAIWTKGHGQVNNVTEKLARTYECFFYGFKPERGSGCVLKQGRSNNFEFRGVVPSDKYHPTQRPLSLMEEIIDVFGAKLPKDKNKIFVPFLGSGITILAANQMGYKAFGFDKNPDYKSKFLYEIRREYAKKFEI